MGNNKITLKELLDGCNPEYRNKEIDFGGDVGRERIGFMTDEEYAKEYLEFNPDYLIPPSETLKEFLSNKGIEEDELPRLLGLEEHIANGLLNDEIQINETIAEALNKAFDIPVSFWINLENNYQKQKLKKSANEE